ncbi:MAG: Nif3-like dinuclear metal center hexameric protein [Thermoanaerobaculia bacterium]
MQIHELIRHCDQLLDAAAVPDYGPNGLQIEGHRDVRRIVTGVSGGLELFERAREAGADAVFAHHGILWDSQPRAITGFQYRRVRALVESGMHFAAYHLPLDRHAELGNNALAAHGLGLYSLEPFGRYHGVAIGFRGHYPEPIAVPELVARCRALFGQEPLAFPAGPDPVATVGVITGGGAGEVHQAIAAGLDAYVTGEPAEWVMNVARENRIHFLACGHYATERLGIRALGEHLAERFALEHQFIDLPNPV